MKKSWLTYKIITKISETEFQESGVKWNYHTDPFNLATHHWKNLKVEMKPGDELWLFSSPDESWRMLSGRYGVCIVREGEIVRSELAIMS